MGRYSLWDSGPSDAKSSWDVHDYKVIFTYVVDGPRLQAILREAGVQHMCHLPPSCTLPFVTSEVRIIIKGEHQVSAKFTGQECCEALKDAWPSADNFDDLFVAVNSRARYPMPKPEIPVEDQKSCGAQGQTKKPGSHSQDRHK